MINGIFHAFHPPRVVFHRLLMVSLALAVLIGEWRTASART
jgi:hypothetical protein